MIGEVVSAHGPRRSSVVPSQGGWSLRYSQDGLLASECFFLDERAAHKAASAWEWDGVVPRSAQTLPGLAAINDEAIECWRFDVAAMALEARS